MEIVGKHIKRTNRKITNEPGFSSDFAGKNPAEMEKLQMSRIFQQMSRVKTLLKWKNRK